MVIENKGKTLTITTFLLPSISSVPLHFPKQCVILEVPIPKANIYLIKDNLSPEKAVEEYEHQLKQLVANKKLKTLAVTVMAKFDLMLLGMVQTGTMHLSSASIFNALRRREDATDAVKVTLGEHADYGYPLPLQKVKPEGGYTWFLDKAATSLPNSVTTDGETRGAIISAMEGQSREAIDAGWTPLCAAIVPNFYLPMHSYELKNMYLMTLLNLSARVCKLTSVKRRGLVDQRRSFNGEVAASTFSTAVATEHVGSSRDETQGVSASYIDLGDCTWKKAVL
ncbi:probable 6-phosphogluconolactonase 4, chloroplastic [Tanacetum coccineum]